MTVKVLLISFAFLFCQFVSGQTSHDITNSDVISMTKAGIGEQTIILAIQRGPVKFDTSPQALIAMKHAGVPDRVLNAILTESKTTSPVPASQLQTVSQPADKQAIPQGNVQRSLPNEEGSSFCSSRTGETSVASTVRTACCEKGSGSSCSNLAHFYETGAEGLPKDQSITNLLKKRACEEGSYADCSIEINDPTERRAFETDMSLTSPTAKAASLNAFLEVYPQSVVKPTVLRVLEEIKHQASTTPPPPSPNSIAVQRLPQTVSQGLTLRVLQEQSIPYTAESGGGISTSCTIVGNANTSAYANVYGNSAYGNATTNSSQHMSCNSYDTTMRWPHIMNVMFAQASNGNSYIIACDRAWRWSKCVPLRAGDTFSARFTDKGIEVQAVSAKGKEENPVYHILQSRSWR